MSSKKLNIIWSFIGSVILLLLGALLGFYFQKLQLNQQNKLQHLDYRIRDQITITKPTIPEKNIKILLDEKEIETLREIIFSLYNFSEKDFNDLNIYISILPPTNSDFEILGDYPTIPNGIPEIIKRIDLLSNLTKEEQFRYCYQIKTLNRNTDIDADFQVRYLYKGSEPPNIKVYTDKKGVKLQAYSYNYNGRSTYVLFISLIILIIILYTLFYIIQNFDVKRFYIRDKYLINELIDKFNECDVTKNWSTEQKLIEAKKILNNANSALWEKTNLLQKFWYSIFKCPKKIE